MSDSREISSRSQIVVAGLVAAVVGVALYMTVFDAPSGGGSGNPMAFPDIEVDREKLESERRDKYGDARKAAPEAKAERLRSIMARLNALQFPPDGDTARQSKLADKLSIKANGLIPQTGYDGFVAVGEPLFERCSEGLGTLLAAIRSGEISADRARGDPPADGYETYRRNCGPFLETLLERSLVSNSGAWAEPKKLHRAIAGILQRLRWATIVERGHQRLDQLTDYETRLLMRWRIESESYPLKERREYVEIVANSPSIVPNYDATLARARLLYAGNHPGRAAEVLRSALDGDPESAETYRRALAWLRDNHPDAVSSAGGGS